MSGAFPNGLNTAMGQLLLAMNTYYSSSIDGEQASPQEMAQALAGELSTESGHTRLERLAVTHMET